MKRQSQKSFSTYTPVYLHDSITIEAMLALPPEERRGKKSSVDLNE